MSEDDWSPYSNQDDINARVRAEDDLRVRMFALDMAVTALPHLTSSIETEDMKLSTVRRASIEFEKILRGQTGS